MIFYKVVAVLASLLATHPAIHSAAAALPAIQDSPIRIQAITFEGNRNISTQQLKLVMRMSREGSEYFPANLQSDLRLIERTYLDSGFLKVKLEVPEVRVEASGDGKTAVIRVILTEGPRYGTGALAVKDSKAIPSETILQLCPLRQGQPYSPLQAAQWQAKVEDSFRSMGYLKAQCPLREAVDEAAKTVDCTLQCSQGKIYSVGKIGVTGGRSVNLAELKRRLLFSEGGIFNPEMLTLSIQMLNQARLYAPISGSDVELRIDDEKGLVDVMLRVAPRAE